MARAAGKSGDRGELAGLWAAGPGAHLALQVNGWVAVGEILPEQQRVFVLFPRQAVTVVVKIKGLPPVG